MVEKLHDLEIRIIKLESHLKTAIIVAMIFGLTGAWGFNLLTKSNEKLNKLKGDIEKLDENMKILQDKIKDINIVLTSSIKKEWGYALDSSSHYIECARLLEINAEQLQQI